MQPLRWGILGTGGVVRRNALPALRACENAVPVAVASRDPSRARALAEEFGIAQVCGSYQELVLSRNVDAVYVALPNHLHVEWVEKAARAGKAVLCEKPLGISAREVEHVRRVAAETGQKIMEGMVARFHPVHGRARQRIAQGDVGQVRLVRVGLGWTLERRPEDYRWHRDRGGGALLDVGCYAVSAARLLVGSEPCAVSARAVWAEPEGVDTFVTALLMFAREATAIIDCGIECAAHNMYEVVGTDGRLVVQDAFGNRYAKRKLILYNNRGEKIDEEEHEEVQMREQFRQFSRAVLEDLPVPVSLEDSLANARALDAIRTSAQREGERIPLGEA